MSAQSWHSVHRNIHHHKEKGSGINGYIFQPIGGNWNFREEGKANMLHLNALGRLMLTYVLCKM